MSRWISIIFVCIVGGLATQCAETSGPVSFEIEDEQQLGELIAERMIEREDISILLRENNATAYAYADSRLAEITSSNELSKREQLDWTITLLDDERRVAFAYPGGGVAITTGMIFYLENEDQLSGILAHLVAHIDQSDVSTTLIITYGINRLKNITSSNVQLLDQVIDDLFLSGDFKYSRASEISADSLSVSILSATSQSCAATGLVFDRYLNVQPETLVAMIDAYRIDIARVSSITELAENSGCDTSVDAESATRYRAFRNSIF